jgi:hypothetical protein
MRTFPRNEACAVEVIRSGEDRERDGLAEVRLVRDVKGTAAGDDVAPAHKCERDRDAY